jgi:hypothetical protein
MLMNALTNTRSKSPKHKIGKRLSMHVATPVALGSLYSRIQELEERLHQLEGKGALTVEQKTNGKKPAKANGQDLKTAVVVISSVVASLIDKPHRLVSVSPLDSASHSACPWALQGRMLLHEARS